MSANPGSPAASGPAFEDYTYTTFTHIVYSLPSPAMRIISDRIQDFRTNLAC